MVEIVAVCEDDDVDRAIDWLCTNRSYYSNKLEVEEFEYDMREL